MNTHQENQFNSLPLGVQPSLLTQKRNARSHHRRTQSITQDVFSSISKEVNLSGSNLIPTGDQMLEQPQYPQMKSFFHRQLVPRKNKLNYEEMVQAKYQEIAKTKQSQVCIKTETGGDISEVMYNDKRETKEVMSPSYQCAVQYMNEAKFLLKENVQKQFLLLSSINEGDEDRTQAASLPICAKWKKGPGETVMEVDSYSKSYLTTEDSDNIAEN